MSARRCSLCIVKEPNFHKCENKYKIKERISLEKILTGVLSTSIASSAFLIARKMKIKYKTESLTIPRGPSTSLALTKSRNKTNRGLQKES
jgi:predicted alpha/beta-fold hydrolase